MLKDSTKQNINTTNEYLQNQQLYQLQQQHHQQTNTYSFCQTQEISTSARQSLNIQNQKTQDQQKKANQGNQIQCNPQITQSKKLSESMGEKSNIITQELNNSVQMPARKGRSQKSRVQQQLNEANKSLQAFRDKSNELQQRQNTLKNQYSGLSEKRKKFDQEIGDFNLNSKQLQEYTNEVQRDLRKVNQNQKEVDQDTRVNLTELANQLLQYRDQTEIMEQLGDAISQKDQILKRIMEITQQNDKENYQMQQQRELEKLLHESSQSIEELDKKIKELTIQNLQLSQSLKEKADKINELVLKLSEKDQLEINLRNQINLLNQQQINQFNQQQDQNSQQIINGQELLKLQEKSLQENFAVKEKTYISRITVLETQLQEKVQQETSLRAEILDLKSEIQKYQKIGKQTENMNGELKNVLQQNKSEIEHLKIQIESIHQLNNKSQQELRLKQTQSSQHGAELQTQASYLEERKKDISDNSFYAVNTSQDRPANRASHISSVQIDSARTGRTDLNKIEKDSQMNQVFNELRIYNEQTNKPTLSQMKLKTMPNAQITQIVSTIKSNYVSRDTSADLKQPPSGYVSINNGQNSSYSSQNIASITQVSSSQQAYHPPLSVGGNTTQFLQNRVVPSQTFVFKHPHHPQKIIEMSPISRQGSVSKQIYHLMKQSNVSNSSQISITPAPHQNSTIIKQTQ